MANAFLYRSIAIKKLREVGIETEGHIQPNLGHSIDAKGIQIGCDFFKRIFN